MRIGGLIGEMRKAITVVSLPIGEQTQWYPRG